MTNESKHPYADLLDAARPEPPARYARMDRMERAGQFGAFSAVVGYESAVGALSQRLASGDLAAEDIDAFVEEYFGEVLQQDLILD